MKNICVPSSIGICMDGFGFPGILDLRIIRSKYGSPEYLGLIKDRGSAAYLVDFQRNENSKQNYVLMKAESVHAGGLYYATDTGTMEGADRIESYVLYLDEETYCRFETRKTETSLPDVVCEKRKWNHLYEVVKERV